MGGRQNPDVRKQGSPPEPSGGAPPRLRRLDPRRLRERLPDDLRETLAGSVLVFAGKVLGAGFAFLYNVALGRLVGADGTGVYFLAASLAIIAGALGRLGLDHSVLRFAGANLAPEQRSRLAGVHRQSVLLAAGGSAATSVILFSAAPLIATHAFSDPSLTPALRLMALVAVPLSLGELYAQLLYGIRRTRDATFLQGIARPAVALGLLFPLAILWGTQGAILALLGSHVAVAVLGAFMWRRATPQLRGVRGRFDFRVLFATSVPLFWVEAMNLVITTTDTIMLGVWTASAVVGVYSVALRTASLAEMAYLAVNNVVGPRFAALWEQGDRAGLQRLARGVTGFMAALAGCILLGTFLFADFLLGLFGPEFVAGRNILLILVAAEAFALATGPFSYILAMTGHERFYRNVVITTAVLNLGLNALLIPLYGGLGAAWATGASIIIQNALYLVAAKRAVGVTLLGPSPATDAAAGKGGA